GVRSQLPCKGKVVEGSIFSLRRAHGVDKGIGIESEPSRDLAVKLLARRVAPLPEVSVEDGVGQLQLRPPWREHAKGCQGDGGRLRVETAPFLGYAFEKGLAKPSSGQRLDRLVALAQANSLCTSAEHTHLVAAHLARSPHL